MAFETSFKIKFESAGLFHLGAANMRLFKLAQNLETVNTRLNALANTKAADKLLQLSNNGEKFRNVMSEVKKDLKETNTALSSMNRTTRDFNNSPLQKVKGNIMDIGKSATAAGDKIKRMNSIVANMKSKDVKLNINQRLNQSGRSAVGYGSFAGSYYGSQTTKSVQSRESRPAGHVRDGMLGSIPMASELRSILNVVRGALVFTVLMKSGQAMKTVREAFVDANSTIAESKIVLNSFLGDDQLVNSIVDNAQELSAKYGYAMDDIMAINKELITKLIQDGKKIDASLLKSTVKTMMMIDKMSATQMGLRYVGFSIKEMLEGEGVADFRSMRNRLGIVMPKEEMRKISELAKNKDKAGALKLFQQILEDMGFKQSVLEDIIQKGFAGAIAATSGMMKTLFQRLGVDSMEAFIRPFRRINKELSYLLSSETGKAKLKELSKEIAIPFDGLTHVVDNFWKEMTQPAKLEEMFNRVKSSINMISSLTNVAGGFIVGLLFGKDSSKATGADLIDEIAVKINDLHEPFRKLGEAFNKIAESIAKIVTSLETGGLMTALGMLTDTLSNVVGMFGGLGLVGGLGLLATAKGLGGIGRAVKGGAGAGGAASAGLFGGAVAGSQARVAANQAKIARAKEISKIKQERLFNKRLRAKNAHINKVEQIKAEKHAYVESFVSERSKVYDRKFGKPETAIDKLTKDREMAKFRQRVQDNADRRFGRQLNKITTNQTGVAPIEWVRAEPKIPKTTILDKVDSSLLFVVSNLGTLGMALAALTVVVGGLQSALNTLNDAAKLNAEAELISARAKLESYNMSNIKRKFAASGVRMANVRNYLQTAGEGGGAITDLDSLKARLQYEAESGNTKNIAYLMQLEKTLDKLTPDERKVVQTMTPESKVFFELDLMRLMTDYYQKALVALSKKQDVIDGKTNYLFNQSNTVFVTE